jgi:hypothetical protein
VHKQHLALPECPLHDFVRDFPKATPQALQESTPAICLLWEIFINVFPVQNTGKNKFVGSVFYPYSVIPCTDTIKGVEDNIHFELPSRMEKISSSDTNSFFLPSAMAFAKPTSSKASIITSYN